MIKDFKLTKDLMLNLDALDLRIWQHKKAALILIDGGLGEGKTTLAVQIVDYINSLHNKPPLNLKDVTQLAMGGEDFIRKLNQCYVLGLPAIIYDESGDFNKRGTLTKLNATLNRVFETFRAYKILVILCLPSISVLDNGLFDKNIPRLFMRCYGRTATYGRILGYDLERINWLRYWFKQHPVKNEAYRKVSPLFHTYFRNLPQARCDLLDQVSTKAKRKELGAASIKLDGLLSYEEIAGKVVRSPLWVKLTCKKLGIKAKRKYERRYYFDAGVVDTLLDFQDKDKRGG